MGRPRKIDVSPGKALARIVECYDATLAAIDTELAELKAKESRRRELSHDEWNEVWPRLCFVRREREHFLEHGLPYNLPRLAQKELSPSERITWQKTIRKLYDDYHVDLEGQRATHVRPTDKGRQYLASLKPEASNA